MEHEPPSPSTFLSPSPASSSPPSGAPLQRTHSLGEAASTLTQERAFAAGTPATADWESSVWAMELRGNLIAAGRSSGKLEVCKVIPVIQLDERCVSIQFYLNMTRYLLFNVKHGSGFRCRFNISNLKFAKTQNVNTHSQQSSAMREASYHKHKYC